MLAITGFLATMLTATASPYVASPPPTAVGPASDDYSYEVQQVADRVHLVVRPDALRQPPEGNVEVIEQADGLVVVDAGGSPLGGRRIVEKIRSISRKPVKYLIYTHWHGDHHLGAGAFRQAWPAMRIISTPGTRGPMTGPQMDYITTLAPQMRKMPEYAPKLAQSKGDAEEKVRIGQLIADGPKVATAYDGVKVWPADLTFDKDLSIPDADAPVEVMFLGRANTDGDAVVWTPKQKVLITGDIVVAPIPYGTESYPADWIEVLKKLKAYDFAALIPGHGEVEHDRVYLDDLIALIEDVRAQVEPLAKQGMSLDDIKKKVDFEHQYEVFCGQRTFWRRALKQFFLDSMIASASSEARGEPILQK
jgi:glyoxylase-like metal-dependent hydrolase (beta-lactamase superfamily II)